MSKTINIIVNEDWIHFIDNDIVIESPPKCWVNFIRANNLKCQSFDIVNQILVEYTAYVWPIHGTEDIDRFLVFDTDQGYCEFMLRWA